MTRDVAASLFGGNLTTQTSPSGENVIVTSLGTPVVVGSGYTGAGPDGDANAAPSGTNKWMYVTGPVTVHLGDAEIDNDSYAQGFNTSTNDLVIRGSRPAAVYFDPTLHYAAQVTLS